MVTLLAGSISWCGRKQGGETKSKQILILHSRSSFNLRFLGSPTLTWSPLLLMFQRLLEDRSIRKMAGFKFQFCLFLSKWAGHRLRKNSLCNERECDLKEPSCRYCSEQMSADTDVSHILFLQRFHSIDGAQFEVLCPVICEHFSWLPVPPSFRASAACAFHTTVPSDLEPVLALQSKHAAGLKTAL